MHLRHLALAVIVASFSVTSASAQHWKRAWSDEFNGAANTQPDPTKWTYDLGTHNGWGNRELQSYTSDAANAHMDGKGHLVIRAEQVNADGAPGAYTSARLKTEGLFAVGPGSRVEARIKVPSRAGMWPAFWMLGDNKQKWPQRGEIDIMESLGREPTKNHGSMHGPGYSGSKPMTAILTLPHDKKFADRFHVFAIEWETNEVRFYVDKTLYETVRDKDIPQGTEWVYNQPFYLLLNLAVGGNFGGPVGPETTFPREMLVDYVRVYKYR